MHLSVIASSINQCVFPCSLPSWFICLHSLYARSTQQLLARYQGKCCRAVQVVFSGTLVYRVHLTIPVSSNYKEWKTEGSNRDQERVEGIPPLHFWRKKHIWQKQLVRLLEFCLHLISPLAVSPLKSVEGSTRTLV